VVKDGVRPGSRHRFFDVNGNDFLREVTSRMISREQRSGAPTRPACICSARSNAANHRSCNTGVAIPALGSFRNPAQASDNQCGVSGASACKFNNDRTAAQTVWASAQTFCAVGELTDVHH